MKNFTMVGETGETKKVKKQVRKKGKKVVFKRINVAFQSVKDIAEEYKDSLIEFNKEVLTWKKFVCRYETKTKYVKSFTKEDWDRIEIKINEKRKELYDRVGRKK